MVDVVISGTVALDSIKTPFGEAPEVLGGSAVYSSVAASGFAKAGIISVVRLVRLHVGTRTRSVSGVRRPASRRGSTTCW